MIQRQPFYAQVEHSGDYPIASQTLSEAITRRRAAKTKPPAVSASCLNGKHFNKCFKKDCVCECHTEEGKL